MKKKFVHILLVGLQVLLIPVVIFTGSANFSHFSMVLIVLGTFLGIFAFFSMGIDNFNISPALKKGGIFINKGPYKYIRHPMYTSIIISLLPFIYTQFNIIAFISFTLLVIVLFLKMHIEEKILSENFPEYVLYVHKSKRIIPFLY